MNERPSRPARASGLQGRAIGDPPTRDLSSRGTHIGPKKGTHQDTHQGTHQENSKKRRSKSKKIPKRIRRIPYIFGNDHLDDKLCTLLNQRDYRLRMYVYRMQDNRRITPAFLICRPFPDLLECLRDEYHGGDFALIIRRGKMIELSGIVRIGSPLRRV